MTIKEMYSVLFVVKNSVNDRLYVDVCARFGAPGTPAQWFIDKGCLLSDNDRRQLSVMHNYLSEQLRNLFMIGHDYGWDQLA